MVAVTVPRCAQCRAMRPDLESVAAAFRDRIPIEVIDAAQEPELVAALGIRAIPSLVLHSASGDFRLLPGRRGRAELTALAESLISAEGPAGPGRKEKTDVALRLVAGAALAGGGLALPAPVLSATGAVVLVWALGSYFRTWMSSRGDRFLGPSVNRESEPPGRARRRVAH